MPSSTEGTKTSDFLVNEFDPRFNRATYLAEGAVVKGQILKTGTAGTQRTAVVAAGTSANCVALNDAANGEKVVVLERGPALLNRSGLTYGSGANNANKDATDALLLALGMKVATNIV